jgi:DNA invertase Pin-like site-specific DNA recombinase
MSLIACYCRVSTRHQKNDSQRAEIKRWLKNNGLDMSSVRWFEDKETGATTRRFAFDQLQKAIFDGVVKTVVVWKLDRISRRQRDGINVLADWCERDVRVVSVTQQIDLNGAVGRMVASVMFGLAEIELEYRRERQAAGIRVARKKGAYTGRLKGTTKGKPDRANALKDQGLTIAEIANAMAVNKRTIFRYLSRK